MYEKSVAGPSAPASVSRPKQPMPDQVSGSSFLLSALCFQLFSRESCMSLGDTTIDENEESLLQSGCHDQRRGRFTSGAFKPARESDPGILSE